MYRETKTRGGFGVGFHEALGPAKDLLLCLCYLRRLESLRAVWIVAPRKIAEPATTERPRHGFSEHETGFTRHRTEAGGGNRTGTVRSKLLWHLF